MNLTVFFILSIFSTVLCQTDWYKDMKTISLTPETFKNYAGSDKHLVLEFFTPWCVYCKQMKAIWEKLNDDYTNNKNIRKDIVIAKINCDDYSEFCGMQRVQSFPTINFYQAGDQKKTNYYGMRQYDLFQKWIEKSAGKEKQKEQIEEKPSEEKLTETDLKNEEVQQVEKLEDKKEKQVETPKANKKDIEIKENKKKEEEIVEAVQHSEELEVLEKIEFREDNLELRFKELVNSTETKYAEVELLLKNLHTKFDNFTETATQRSTNKKKINQNHAVVFILVGFFLGIVVTYIMIATSKTASEKKLTGEKAL